MTKNNCLRVLTILGSATLAFSGLACHGPCNDQTATQLHQSHMDRAKALHGRELDDMVDNAILHDMSLADFHFVPHTGEISGTGVERLNRMARLLSVYGGTVNYQTDLADAQLIGRRIDHVKEYLTVAGVDMDRVQVTTGLSQGRGAPARKAMEIEARGTANPKQSGGATGFAAPMSPTAK